MHLQRTQQIQTKPGFLQRDYPFICHFKLFWKGSRITNAADYPNIHQCGFQKGLSSIDASFVLQETINHYEESNDGSCVSFLDSSKAIDTVWHTGLLYKLSEIWLILYRIYNNAKSCVFVTKHFPHYFRQHRGLCQGSILSPKLYVLYINNLLNMLSHSKKGYMVLDIQVSCPTQADDIAKHVINLSTI